MKQWNDKHLKQLLQSGRIRGYEVSKNNTKKQVENSQKMQQIIPTRSKEKDWLGWNLAYWANEHALQLEEEYAFHSERKWRFDYCFPAIKVAVEYEGIFNGGKAHTATGNILRDIEKYNAATALGWRIIRITAKDYKTILSQLKNYLQ